MDRSAPCPICNGPRNHTSHYISCRPIKPLWTRLASLLELPPLTAPQILLGRDLELGACHFVTILWKFVIGCIFAGESHSFDLEKRLWTQTCRTFADRALALQFRIRNTKFRARYRKTTPTDNTLRHRASPYSGFSKRLSPLAHVDPYGDVRWSHAFAAQLSACKLNRYLSKNRSVGNTGV